MPQKFNKNFVLLFFAFIFALAIALGFTACDLTGTQKMNPANLNSAVLNNNDLNLPVDLKPTPEISPDSKISNIPSWVTGNEKYEFILSSGDGMIGQVMNKVTGKIEINDVTKLCGRETMSYRDTKIYEIFILIPWNPGMGGMPKEIFNLNIANKTCQKLELSKELSAGFGAYEFSPDRTKMAYVSEDNEGRVLLLLDFINDKVRTLKTLPEGETFNAGYGAHSNYFEIKWLDDNTIKYSVFKDTVKNFADNMPNENEVKLREGTVNIK